MYSPTSKSFHFEHHFRRYLNREVFRRSGGILIRRWIVNDENAARDIWHPLDMPFLLNRDEMIQSSLHAELEIPPQFLDSVGGYLSAIQHRIKSSISR